VNNLGGGKNRRLLSQGEIPAPSLEPPVSGKSPLNAVGNRHSGKGGQRGERATLKTSRHADVAGEGPCRKKTAVQSRDEEIGGKRGSPQGTCPCGTPAKENSKGVADRRGDDADFGLEARQLRHGHTERKKRKVDPKPLLRLRNARRGKSLAGGRGEEDGGGHPKESRPN